MPTDEHFMERALALAAATAGLASPNPQVGCVLVRNGAVIGEGAHLYEGRDHAEIVALKQAAARGLSPAGATAFVTLEPCSHHGRTPPCADALVAAGIARAVVATTDPNPLVSGQGIRKLRDAGIEVTLGICEAEAREINDAFAHFMEHRRPFVTLKAALSADGMLAPDPATRLARQPHWLTGPAARDEVQLLRHRSDAILTGIGTVLADDPGLTDRSGILGPGGLPRRRPLLRVVLDSHLRTPLTSRLIQTAAATPPGAPPDLLLLHTEDAPTDAKRALEASAPGRIEVVRLPSASPGRLSLPAVLNLLAERNCLSLLLECGSELNGAFLSQDLVDKAVLYFSEQELGSAAIPFAQGYAPQLLLGKLRHTRHATIGQDTVVTGYLHHPWPTDR